MSQVVNRHDKEALEKMFCGDNMVTCLTKRDMGNKNNLQIMNSKNKNKKNKTKQIYKRKKTNFFCKYGGNQ